MVPSYYTLRNTALAFREEFALNTQEINCIIELSSILESR